MSFQSDFERGEWIEKRNKEFKKKQTFEKPNDDEIIKEEFKYKLQLGTKHAKKLEDIDPRYIEEIKVKKSKIKVVRE